jgi:hypothetical protein
MKNDKISVIVPIYNVQNYLDESQYILINNFMKERRS